ncbi:hypothetical protein D172_007950 [Pseudoalteromonas sp. Bsw20308]|nr:hypothetical protein D172_007950 [Pseudoalteromonas sp. Bsw20308]
MNKLRIGVNLAHKLIQVCSSANNKVHSNNEMTLQQFSEYLISLSPSTIIFEACASANYWHQFATSLGHNSLLISARLVMSVRQSQKQIKMMLWLFYKHRCYQMFTLLLQNQLMNSKRNQCSN